MDLPYGRQWIDDDDIEAVVRQLRDPWLTQGPTVARFEEALCQATGAAHAVAVANGTAALHLAALAAGVRAGDVGITSTITFVASANALRYCGGRPVLLDVDPDTALAPADGFARAAGALAARGTPPKVLVPVDFAGTPADLAGVRAVADRHGALVIEDAAHSLGASYGDPATRAGGCLHAHLATLSFHPVKHVTTGEGGAVLTNDDALARELRDLRTHGITKDPARLSRDDGPWYYEQQSLGFNYRLTDLQCALGLSQLAKLDRFVARRRELASRYDAAFATHADDVRPLAVPSGARSAYHLYVVRVAARPGEDVAGVARRRKAVYLALREARVFAQVHYIPVHHQPDFVRAGLAEGAFPGAEVYYASCLSLPMFPAMGDGDVDRVVGLVVRATRAS